MNQLVGKIEALLFLSTKPVAVRKMAKILEVSEQEIQSAMDELKNQKNTPESGLHLLFVGGSVQLVTNPEFADVLQSLSKEDAESELTRPQLETLTIIAYRGPITKAEIEHIRGVNCSMILRNLLMRGLVDETEDSLGIHHVYSISADMLRHLGLHELKELPEYERFHKNAKIDQMLENLLAGSEEEV